MSLRSSNFKLSEQLLLSHFGIAAIAAAILAGSAVLNFKLSTRVGELINRLEPQDDAAETLLLGISRSLAAMRGWVTLSEPRFIDQWSRAWEQEIYPALGELERLHAQRPLESSQSDLKQLKLLLRDLDESQWWVRSVAQSPGNEPARVSYDENVQPLALTLERIITGLETEAIESDQSEFTQVMLDLHHSFQAFKWSVNDLLNQGIADRERDITAHETSIRLSLQQLAALSRLPKARLELLEGELAVFIRLSRESARLRLSPGWNRARDLMEKETFPLAEEITAIVQQLSADASREVKESGLRTENMSQLANGALILALILLLSIAWVTARSRSRAIAAPISRLADAALRFRDGALDEAVVVQGAEELESLCASFNDMRLHLNSSRLSLKEMNERLEERVKARTHELSVARDRLEESERRFRSTFNLAAIGIGTVGTAGEWIAVNPKLCSILGYRESELLRKRWQEVTHSEDDAIALQELLSGKRHDLLREARYIKSDGNRIWVRVTASVVLDGDGDLRYCIVIVEDIDTRRQSEEKLKQAAAVFRNTGEGVVITDSEQIILDVNCAFEQITGYRRDDVVGRHPRMLKSGNHDEAFYRSMWSDIAESGRWSGELWNRARDGRVYPERLTIDSVLSDEGEITGYVGVFSDITSLKSNEARLSFIASHDALTELPNRSLFLDRLGQGIGRARRTGSGLAVVFLDVDRFKSINDTLGHDVGDKLLVGVAQRLKAVTRAGDTVARISGDEFCLVLEDLQSPEKTVPTVEKLLSVFDQTFPINNHVLHISSSLGVALYPDNSEDPETLMRYADAAMYSAKEAGRNTFKFYNAEMTEDAEEYGFVQNQMRESIKRSHFYLCYQPQIDLRSGRVGSLEVLARWHHPQRGEIYPSVFIPAAESSGLIKELGSWILKSACLQGRAWLDRGCHPFERMYVNVSGLQIHDASFPDVVARCLAETGYPADRLGLEVTESNVMGASDFTRRILLKLREMGIKLAIDDFGTGYSSLSYLKTLPIDKIKIDQSFVRDIPEDANDMAIVSAVVAIGDSLGMAVVAEGVETEEQERYLQEIGCHGVQGYRYHRPMTAPAFEEMIDTPTE